MIRLPWLKRPASTETDQSGFARAARTGWFMLSWLATVAVVAAMLGVIGFIAVPRVMGWHGVIVLSGSMEPELKTGGIAFVEPATANDVKVGNVLTFRRQDNPKTMITHRVVDIQDTGNGLEFTTKGDANAGPDNVSVKASQVVGVVHYYVPEVGNVVDRLHDRTTYYVFIGIPAALLIFSELMSIAAELRKNRSTSNDIEPSGSVEGATL